MKIKDDRHCGWRLASGSWNPISWIARMLGLNMPAGLLKLWVATRKWVLEPYLVDRENVSCKKLYYGHDQCQSVHKTRPLHDYFIRIN